MANQAPRQNQPQQQQAQEDPLATLIRDVQQERQRIREMKEPSAEQLKIEVGGTTLDLLEDTLKMLLGVRNHMIAVQSWVSEEFGKFAEVEQSHEDRLELLETFGGDTQILPEHAQIFLDVIEGCGYVALKLLQGPFPIEAPDEDAIQALTQLQEKCLAAKTLVEGAIMDDSDDGLDDDDGDDDSPSGGLQLPTLSSVQQQQNKQNKQESN